MMTARLWSSGRVTIASALISVKSALTASVAVGAVSVSIT